ncbi:EamA family transporter [Longibacter salinarum]|uniref:EamA family transporter n=1 Tax=Longibacter salinarum TaxID=1850348 RepID=A0A2A8D329_9BACT|nr:DMT family transporter [Longibacter salinarum]PEN15048.1 EamA family transporter [Longibacter salinarum]
MPVTTDRSPLSGIAFLVGAAFFWSLMSVCVKLAGERLPSQQIVWARATVTLVYSYIMIRMAGLDTLFGHNKKLLLLRGLFGFAALTCFFFALTKLPLADATVIHYTNPVFVAIIAAVVLKESLTRWEILGAGASLLGVVFISKPSFVFGTSAPALNPLYVGVALLGAICAATAYVLVRKLRESEHPLVIVFYFPLVASLGSTPTAAFTELQWPSTWEWILLIVGVAGCAQIAQVFITKGLHAVKAGRAMTVTYLQIVFAAVWGLLFFGETIDLWSVAGGLLVVSGTFAANRS